jgi:thymidylate synthase
MTAIDETNQTNGEKELTIPRPVPENPNHEEHQYLNLIRDILENGEHRPDRYDKVI